MNNIYKTILITFNFLLIIGCSSGNDDAPVGVGKIVTSDVIYSLDDFTGSPVKFKKSKEYSVEQLTYAKQVFFGFRKFEEPVDYEIRFFDSHNDALNGETLVRERAGTEEEIKLKKDEAVFTEGLKDVRECVGSGSQRGMGGDTSGGAGVGGHCLNSKYKNYVIQGNFILLCHGIDPKDSLENCEKLLALLEK
ncbi:MAG: hypothetical protein CL907_05080 [Dehalococcoidia bacterium]|nr:hypothetical protein [Dehalococcoidia bacterium]|tara:strand:+ start:9299 stop:9877 length:579 start_codon:yes stop_codon:yes gene_type:complete